MNRPVSSLSNRVLLVEGQNDKHVVWQLCNRCGVPLALNDILDRGGLDPLLRTVGAEIQAEGRQAVGILVDANRDLMARWDEIRHQLLRAEIRKLNDTKF